MGAEAQTTVELRSAAIFQTSKHYREKFGSIGASYQIELRSTPCYYPCFENWANFDFYSKHCKVKNCCNGKSRVEILNFSLGIDYVFASCDPFDFYVGIGPALAIVKLKNKGCCGKHERVNNPFGLVLKSGARYYFYNRFFLDLFVDYFYQPINYHHRIDIGGFKTGAGIGVQF